jgi:hypothetical protein
MRGIIKPEPRFEAAVIAADHTGKENEIADLLQSFEHEKDISFSMQMLDLFLQDLPLPEKAKSLVEERKRARVKLQKMVSEGVFKMVEGVAYADVDETIDAGLLPALLPAAKAIVIGMPGKENRTNMKVRLTPASPTGINLGTIGLEEGFGGRWNAGSNKRSGGTVMTTAAYAKHVSEKLNSRLS